MDTRPRQHVDVRARNRAKMRYWQVGEHWVKGKEVEVAWAPVAASNKFSSLDAAVEHEMSATKRRRTTWRNLFKGQTAAVKSHVTADGEKTRAEVRAGLAPLKQIFGSDEERFTTAEFRKKAMNKQLQDHINERAAQERAAKKRPRPDDAAGNSSDDRAAFMEKPIKELRDMLGERGLETKGRRKKTLVDRLLADAAASGAPSVEGEVVASAAASIVDGAAASARAEGEAVASAPAGTEVEVGSADPVRFREIDKRVLLLQLKRPRYDQIKAGTKTWEGRPLFSSTDRPTNYNQLATIGRQCMLQSGKGTNDRGYTITDVRRYYPGDQPGKRPVECMVGEIGRELVPETDNLEATVNVYDDMYSAARCDAGFVAFKLAPPDPNLTRRA